MSECLPPALNLALNGSSEELLADGWPGAVVSVVPSGFWLRRRSLPPPLPPADNGPPPPPPSVMVFVGPEVEADQSSDEGEVPATSPATGPGRDGAAGAACWLYPGEGTL